MLSELATGPSDFSPGPLVFRDFHFVEPHADPQTAPDTNLRDEAALALAIDAARTETRIECRRELEEALERKSAQTRQCIADALKAFSTEKARYFQGIEEEVVHLSLGIARKILHREAQIDPLLLAGTVRVALDSVVGRSSAVLRVPPAEIEAWQVELSLVDVSLVADASLEPGQCALQTSVGHADLSIQSQLYEIEKSLTSLIARRPLEK